MVIHHIDHSGFLIEGGCCNLLFDHVHGRLPDCTFLKPLYVFVSHRHSDHFSEKVFNLGAEEVFIDLDAGRRIVRPFFSFSTYPSTDEGVCFLLRFEDRLVYFAGDNGDWYWDEEEKWRDVMHVRTLMSIGHADVAIAPADPRLPDPLRTFSEIFDIMDPSLAIPMHMWGRQAEIVPLLKRRFGKRVEFKDEILF